MSEPVALEDFLREGYEWRLRGELPRVVRLDRSCGHHDLVSLRYGDDCRRESKRWVRSVTNARKCDKCILDENRHPAAPAFVEALRHSQRRSEQGLPDFVGPFDLVRVATFLRDAAIKKHGLDAIRPVIDVRTEADWWVENQNRLWYMKIFREQLEALSAGPQLHLNE